MLRVLALLSILTVAVGCALGERAEDNTTPAAAEDTKADAILELTLPESADPPDYAKERVSKLVIDGKDYSEPRSTKRTVAVKLKPGADSVKVAYTFWPNTYTRNTRTKTIKVEKGKTTKASFLKADGDSDRIWVIFVPTPNEVVEEMCKMAKIQKGDTVYDIGCGDGRMVIAAVKKYGAKKGVGIDLLPERIKECKANAKKAGVEKEVTFIQKDALTIKDFSEANVVLVYLSNPLMEALMPTLRKTLKPGARIVSHRFVFGKKWPAEETKTIKAKDNYGEIDEFDLHRWTIKKEEK